VSNRYQPRRLPAFPCPGETTVVCWQNLDGFLVFNTTSSYKVTVCLAVLSYVQVAHLEDAAFCHLDTTHALSYALKHQ